MPSRLELTEELFLNWIQQSVYKPWHIYSELPPWASQPPECFELEIEHDNRDLLGAFDRYLRLRVIGAIRYLKRYRDKKADWPPSRNMMILLVLDGDSVWLLRPAKIDTENFIDYSMDHMDIPDPNDWL